MNGVGMGLASGSVVNTGDTRDAGSLPGSGRSPGGGPGHPLQYPCLENPMDWGAWWAKVPGVAKSWTQLSMHVHTCTLPSIYLCQLLETLFYSISLS